MAADILPKTAKGVIDHLGYPHIVAKIVAESDYHSLLALRRASSPYRNKVDRILSRHVYLDDQCPPLSSVFGAHPALADNGDPRGEDTNALPEGVASQVHVIDILSFRLGIAKADVDALFKNVKTVRAWSPSASDGYLYFKPEKLILYAWPSPYSNPVRTIPFMRRTNNLKKVVLVVPPTGKVGDILVIWNIFRSSPRVTEFTVIFLPCAKRVTHETTTLGTLMHGLLVSTILAWEQQDRFIKLTFVNSTTLPANSFADLGLPMWLGFIPAEALPNLPDIAEWVWEIFYKPHTTKNPFTFLSLEEYKVKIGETQFALETDEMFRCR